MVSTPTYPGMYVEEIPSGVHPITGVSTSDTAFIDFFPQGPVGVATRVTGFDDFLRQFGPLLDTGSPAGYGVMQFFINGGQVAWIVRVVASGALASSHTLTGGSASGDTLVVSAINPGQWGDSLQVAVDSDVPTPATQFNLVVRQIGQVRGKTQVTASEVHRNVTMGVSDPRYVVNVVAAASSLISVTVASGGTGLPSPTGTNVTQASAIADLSNVSFTPSGQRLRRRDGRCQRADRRPGRAQAHRAGRGEPAVHPRRRDAGWLSVTATPQLSAVAGAVAAFCATYRCFYLLDIPEGIDSTTKVVAWLGQNPVSDMNAAVAFPRLIIVDPDPLRSGALRDIATSGTLAGLYARTDSDRGIWKAPAGTATQLRAIATPSGGKLNDGDSAELNPLGINVIRNLPVYGTVCWGARTLFGADALTSEWKYVPVRRTAMYIEESLVQGLRWVVFEPNDEPLWAQIRLNVGAFMQSLFRRGAFQGKTPREAYLVKCDSETTTQADIDRGIVNILVGFAPLKPAEFVVIQLQQLTQPPDQ